MVRGPRKISSNSRSRRRSKSSKDYSDICCEKCGSDEYEEQLLLCDKCDRGFHLFCLKPILVSVPAGSWFCASCSSIKELPNFLLTQTKIVDFFEIYKSRLPSRLLESETLSQERKKRKRSSRLAVKKKKRNFLPFVPTEDESRRLEQMASLLGALKATGAEFSDELTYVPGMAPRSANDAALEKEGMQVLSKEGIEALGLCKTMMRRGECPPFMVVYDPIEGFTVEADRNIRDLTIISEYVGDVDYWKNRENDSGDSMMTLISANDPAKSLVICPDKRSNISRFINGINNHTPDGKKKQNVKCIRYNVGGESRTILFACRDIKKGERLYYDYNAHENEYPTEHFV